MSANNDSNFTHSTNYQCHVDFLQQEQVENRFQRATVCVRAYKKMAGLYDSLLLLEQVENKQKWVAHLSVSALEKDQIQQINRKFLEHVQ